MCKQDYTIKGYRQTGEGEDADCGQGEKVKTHKHQNITAHLFKYCIPKTF